jgi:lipocalin
MSRQKTLSPEEITMFTEKIKAMGYNIDDLRMVPQQ